MSVRAAGGLRGGCGLREARGVQRELTLDQHREAIATVEAKCSALESALKGGELVPIVVALVTLMLTPKPRLRRPSRVRRQLARVRKRLRRIRARQRRRGLAA